MWNSKRTIIYFILISFISIGVFYMSNNSREKKIIVWMRFKPESTDPLDYDLNVHHVTMRSVYASLVSLYENGKVTPQIAQSWESNSEKDIWKLTLNNDLTFANGDKITPQIVLKTFKRLVLVKNKSDSKSGFLEYLKGFHKLKSMNDNLEGIEITENKLVFSFIKPMPNFLEKVSFGFYSIVHPSQFDDDGKWLNKKNTISSGLYEISKWDNEHFELKLRKNQPKVNYDKKIDTIEFNFSTDPDQVLRSDIILRERLNYLVDEDEWHYASTLEDSNIVYVKIMKWNNPDSIYSSSTIRKSLRNLFYKNLKKAGYEATKSFFPLSIKGVSEFKDSELYNQIPKVSLITMPPFFKPLKSAKNKEKLDLGEIYKLGFEKFCGELSVQFAYKDYPEKFEDEEKIFDLQYLGTGIDIADPYDDIKFMFLSKHGIQLPDSNGNILKLLEKREFNVQEINKELWDQAIIWPIRHYSQGFWIKKSSKIDITKLNLSLNPIDFQFLGLD